MISLETEAAELLMAMCEGVKIKSAQVKDKAERLQMLQIGNQFKRQAANGMAMEYCVTNFTEGLEVHGVEIDFEPTIH